MPKTFYISSLNGLRWSNENPVLDPNLNSYPVDNEIDPQSYPAPIQKTDTEFPVLVCLSDYPDMVLEFQGFGTEIPIATITLGATDSSVVGQTFLQYLAVVDFSAFPTGWCYGRLSYVDENGDTQSWISCPIDVQQNHPDTQLLKYQNSYNTESVLFQPANIILQMRVQGNMVGGYSPKSDNTTYEDQPYSPVLLNGFNYDYYTWYISGIEIQMPDWVIKKLNNIYAKCDQVQIDYEFYVKVGDFKIERPDSTYNRNGYNAQVDLQIVPGFTFGSLTAGTTPTGDLIVVRKTWPLMLPFPFFTASFSIPGTFTQYSTIDYFQTCNPDLSTFILKIGTSLGGNDVYEGEIGTPNADSSIQLIEDHRPLTGFNSAVTIYVTLPEGVNVQIIFIYDQLDSPALNLPTPSGGALPQGLVGMYEETVPGNFARDWNPGTGLGQMGSKYEGCAMSDGRNGTVDRRGMLPFGWNYENATGSLSRNSQLSAGDPIIATATAAIGATSIAVTSLVSALPNGTILTLQSGTGQINVTLTSAAAKGALLLSISPLTVAVNAGATYNQGTTGNEITIARAYLPNEGLSMFGNQQNNTPNDLPGVNQWVAIEANPSVQSSKSYSMNKSTIPPQVGVTDVMGGGGSLSIQNDAIVTLFFVVL